MLNVLDIRICQYTCSVNFPVTRTEGVVILQRKTSKEVANKRKRREVFEDGLALCGLLLGVMLKEEV